MLEEARADVVDYVNGLDQVVADTTQGRKDRTRSMDVLGAEMVKVLTEEHDQATTSGNAALADQLGSAMYAVMDYRLDVMRYLDRDIKEAGDRSRADRAAIEGRLLAYETRAIPGSDGNAIAAIRGRRRSHADAKRWLPGDEGEPADLADNVCRARASRDLRAASRHSTRVADEEYQKAEGHLLPEMTMLIMALVSRDRRGLSAACLAWADRPGDRRCRSTA